MDRVRKAYSRLGAAVLALTHLRLQGSEDGTVEFVEGRLNRANTIALRTATRNECGSEGAGSRAGIEQADRLGKLPEHGSHKSGQRFARKKLPEFSTPFGFNF